MLLIKVKLRFICALNILSFISKIRVMLNLYKDIRNEGSNKLLLNKLILVCASILLSIKSFKCKYKVSVLLKLLPLITRPIIVISPEDRLLHNSSLLNVSYKILQVFKINIFALLKLLVLNITFTSIRNFLY